MVASKVSGIILAGGQGSRMEHMNKGLQLFRGKRLIEHVIDRLRHQVDDIVISANRDINQYASLGYPIAADIGSSIGPLSGIEAAAKHTKHDNIFITACDMPFLPETIVEELRRIATPVVVAQSNKGIEPLACCVNQEAIGTISSHVASGQRSVVKWLESCGAVKANMSHLGDKAFLNINTVEQLGSSDHRAQ